MFRPSRALSRELLSQFAVFGCCRAHSCRFSLYVINKSRQSYESKLVFIEKNIFSLLKPLAGSRVSRCFTQSEWAVRRQLEFLHLFNSASSFFEAGMCRWVRSRGAQIHTRFRGPIGLSSIWCWVSYRLAGCDVKRRELLLLGSIDWQHSLMEIAVS